MNQLETWDEVYVSTNWARVHGKPWLTEIFLYGSRTENVRDRGSFGVGVVSTITRFVLGRHILSDHDEELQEPLRSTYNKGIALLGVR